MNLKARAGIVRHALTFISHVAVAVAVAVAALVGLCPAVIDPAESRNWVTRILKSVPAPKPRDGKKRFVDTW